MAMELARRGADEGVVDAMMAEFFSGSELEAVRDAAERWSRRGKRDWQALARHLDRKGFAAGSIWTVVDEVKSRWAEEPE
jgi:SOS response regulatory protein OraA/RecX